MKGKDVLVFFWVVAGLLGLSFFSHLTAEFWPSLSDFEKVGASVGLFGFYVVVITGFLKLVSEFYFRKG